jgi:hypothetical protein
MDCITLTSGRKTTTLKEVPKSIKYVPIIPKIEVGFAQYYSQLESRTGQKYPRLTKKA